MLLVPFGSIVDQMLLLHINMKVMNNIAEEIIKNFSNFLSSSQITLCSNNIILSDVATLSEKRGITI